MKTVKDQIIDAFGDTEKIHVTSEIMGFLNDLEVKEPDVLEIGMVSAVITHNSFDDLKKWLDRNSKKGSGIFFCFDVISQMAVDFVEKYGEVEEWETFLENSQSDAADWEEFVLEFAWQNKEKYA